MITLSENFDWITFSINDAEEDPDVIAAIESFFLPEWERKRAVRGTTFEDAVSVKVDDEINTNATRAAGDRHAEIKLRLADTTERFIIRVGQLGVFEDVEG